MSPERYRGYRKKSRNVKIATLVPAKVMLRFTLELAISRLMSFYQTEDGSQLFGI
jgi:hypothetical protein